MIDLSINYLNYLSLYVTNLHKSHRITLAYTHSVMDSPTPISSVINLFPRSDNNTFSRGLKGTIRWCQGKSVQVLEIQETKTNFWKLVKNFFFFHFLKTLFKYDHTIYTRTKGWSDSFLNCWYFETFKFEASESLDLHTSSLAKANSELCYWFWYLLSLCFLNFCMRFVN